MPHGAVALGMLLYLLPVAALALLMRIATGAHPIFFLFTVAGTLCHELAHFFAGLVSNARPVGLTVVPRWIGRGKRNSAGGYWELGSVTFANLRWYNAAPAALAPLLVLTMPLAVAWWPPVPVSTTARPTWRGRSCWRRNYCRSGRPRWTGAWLHARGRGR